MLQRRRAFEFGLGIAMPAFLTVAATIAVVFFALSRIADEVNRIDQAHMSVAANASIAELYREIEIALSEQLRSPDYVDELARASPESDFIARRVGLRTRTSEIYAFAYVLDSAGESFVGFDQGARATENANDRFGTDLDKLIASLEGSPDDRTVSGFTIDRKGPVVLALGRVDPLSGAGARRYILIGKHIDNAVVGRLGKSFALRDLAISTEQSTRTNSMPLISPSGKQVASLTWSARLSGAEAYDRARMPILVILSLLLLVMVFLVATIWKTLSAMYQGEEAARGAARRDALSGLPNRTAFNAALQKAFSEPRSSEIAVAFVDLDGFKDVNDTYGHEVGDRLIRSAATGFQALVGDRGLLARLGGDEFAILMTGPSALETALDTGAMMIEFLSEPFDFEGRVVQVGASVGIASTDLSSLTAVELVRRADVAMYEAKARGKNRVEIYLPEFDAKRTEKAKLAAALRKAIGTEELQVHYQPVMDARSGRMVAVEALVRWIRPGIGAVPPSTFVPIAEECGLIEEIGAFVLRTACRDARGWGDMRVAVNVSAAQFRNPIFDETVAAILDEADFPPSRLELDITESYLIAFPERARGMIDSLRRLGIGVSLDDFGTGFSSIGYLRRFAFDKLKIDRSVVLDVVQDPASQKLVEATIALAGALGIHVTAEGIEHEREAEALRAAGCNELQGYHFGSPSTASEIARRLKHAAPPSMRRSA